MRVGQGYDVHRLVAGRPLVIGGVTIPYELGLDGHSDADVLLHALCDALLGAAGLGDIGVHFPPNDDAYQNIDSMILLRKVMQKLRSSDYSVQNVDCTIVAEAPKMIPHIKVMRNNIAACLEVDTEQVNIKATTTETLGYIGRGEGIAAQAIVLITRASI